MARSIEPLPVSGPQKGKIDAGVAKHVDGARLWEAQPYYGRPHAEIAALFDTVYVSLYKGLEGMAGLVHRAWGIGREVMRTMPTCSSKVF